MREYVCVGTPAQVDDFRKRWMTRARISPANWACLIASITPATRFLAAAASSSAVSQIEQALKFELLVPVRSAEQPTACMSFNYHQDHFGAAWNLRNVAGQTMHTGCVAFGMDRLALAMFATHGLDPSWPASVRAALAM